jgi:hypothetical protein
VSQIDEARATGATSAQRSSGSGGFDLDLLV